MEVTYTKPEPGGALYDMDQRSAYDKKSIGGKSTLTTMSQAATRALDEEGNIYDKEQVHFFMNLIVKIYLNEVLQ